MTALQHLLTSDPIYPVLFGVSNSDPHEITLIDCRRNGTRMGYPGYTSALYLPRFAVLGAHLDGDDGPLFSEGRAQMEFLPDWSKFTGLRVGEANDFEISYDSPEPSEAELPDRGCIVLSSSASRSGTAESFHITEQVMLGNKYVDPLPLEPVLSDLSRLQDLVTFATDRHNGLIRIEVLSPQAQFDRWPFEVLAQQIQPKRYTDRRRTLLAKECLFTLPDAPGGFEQLVPRWHELLAKVDTAIHLLLSVYNAPFMYIGTRFLHLAQAAEVYHRLLYGGQRLATAEHRLRVRTATNAAPQEVRSWLKDSLSNSNDLRLADRLSALLTHAGQALEAMIASPDLFLVAAKDTRNYLTHSGRKGKALVDPEGQVWLGDAIAWVMRACILQQLGFSQEQVAELFQRNPRYQWASHRLPVVTCF